MRHETFRTPEFYDLLRRHEVALVLADNPGQWPIIDETTADLNYVRLHGHEELYASGYSDEALDGWAARIRGWRDAGQDVYIYCDNDAKVRAPYDAMGLMQRLGLNGDTGEVSVRRDSVRRRRGDAEHRREVVLRHDGADRHRGRGAGGALLRRHHGRGAPVAGRSTRFAGPLGEVLAKWQITTPSDEVLQMWHHVNVDAGVVAAVQELRASGIRCALATNQHPERAAYMRESLGYDERVR